MALFKAVAEDMNFPVLATATWFVVALCDPHWACDFLPLALQEPVARAELGAASASGDRSDDELAMHASSP